MINFQYRLKEYLLPPMLKLIPKKIWNLGVGICHSSCELPKQTPLIIGEQLFPWQLCRKCKNNIIFSSDLKLLFTFRKIHPCMTQIASGSAPVIAPKTALDQTSTKTFCHSLRLSKILKCYLCETNLFNWLEHGAL